MRMHYLYKILRLFFCPHKYGNIIYKISYHPDGDKNNMPEYIKYIKECKYCGKMIKFKS